VDIGLYKPSTTVLPVFIVSSTNPSELVSFQGTGFLIAPSLLVTCWHCVKARLPDECTYAVFRETNPNKWKPYLLSNVQQDHNGADLATANVDLRPTMRLTLAKDAGYLGTEVWTYGYPFTEKTCQQGNTSDFTLHPIFLQGYVMRSFYYRHPEKQYGSVPSYELDMPGPEGLSGAPVMRSPSLEVIGVLYGTHDVVTIDEFSSIDPDSGKQQPEVRRIVSFTLAHHTDTLKFLRGAATDGLSLDEYLDRKGIR